MSEAAKIEIATTDKELVYALWDLKSDGVTIEEELHKAEGATHIAVWISAGSAFVAAVTAIVNTTLTHRKKHPDKTQATVYIEQYDEGLRILLDKAGSDMVVIYQDNRTE